MNGILVGAAIIAGGFLGAGLLGIVTKRATSGRLSPLGGMIVYRAVVYGTVVVAVLMGLQHMGVQISVLLGAAGILTVAIGFASQTVASNVISGLFLIGDRPFVIGDVITVGTETGEVRSVDLLSVKLRTFDNRLVRVPNEQLLKAVFTNNTYYPIRRFDIQLQFSPEQDLETVSELLSHLADEHPLCLDEPRPLFQVTGYTDRAVLVQFSVWAARTSWVEARSAFQQAMLRELKAIGVSYPFGRTLVYGAEASRSETGAGGRAAAADLEELR